jgi:hypothetical protein
MIIAISQFSCALGLIILLTVGTRVGVVLGSAASVSIGGSMKAIRNDGMVRRRYDDIRISALF